MKNFICVLMVVLICVGMCGCRDNNSDSSFADRTIEENTETVTLPLIETLEFSVNDVVLNSKPEDLYYQICDIYLSPIEGLSVAEFMERAKESSMQLTYNICEDDIKDIYSDYSDDYLVVGGSCVEIFFYCEEQLVFELIAKNTTNETLALKDCYAYEILEKHEYFSSDALDVKSRSWYCGGIPFGGDGYTYTTIKEAFTNWGLTYEESANNDVTLMVYSEVINREFYVGSNYKVSVRYYAMVDKTTSKVVKFYIKYF